MTFLMTVFVVLVGGFVTVAVAVAVAGYFDIDFVSWFLIVQWGDIGAREWFGIRIMMHLEWESHTKLSPSFYYEEIHIYISYWRSYYMELSRYGCMYAHVTWMFDKCTHQDLQSRGEQQQEEEDQLLLFLQVNKQYILCT